MRRQATTVSHLLTRWCPCNLPLCPGHLHDFAYDDTAEAITFNDLPPTEGQREYTLASYSSHEYEDSVRSALTVALALSASYMIDSLNVDMTLSWKGENNIAKSKHVVKPPPDLRKRRNTTLWIYACGDERSCLFSWRML